MVISRSRLERVIVLPDCPVKHDDREAERVQIKKRGKRKQVLKSGGALKLGQHMERIRLNKCDNGPNWKAVRPWQSLLEKVPIQIRRNWANITELTCRKVRLLIDRRHCSVNRPCQRSFFRASIRWRVAQKLVDFTLWKTATVICAGRGTSNSGTLCWTRRGIFIQHFPHHSDVLCGSSEQASFVGFGLAWMNGDRLSKVVECQTHLSWPDARHCVNGHAVRLYEALRVNLADDAGPYVRQTRWRIREGLFWRWQSQRTNKRKHRSARECTQRRVVNFIGRRLSSEKLDVANCSPNYLRVGELLLCRVAGKMSVESFESRSHRLDAISFARVGFPAMAGDLSFSSLGTVGLLVVRACVVSGPSEAGGVPVQSTLVQGRGGLFQAGRQVQW